MKISSHIRLLILGIAVTAFLFAVGCDGVGANNNTPFPPSSKSLTLFKYKNCAELESEIKEMLIGEMERNLDGMKQYCRYSGDMEPLAQPGSEEDGATAENSGAETTQTNVQEEGVDEADLIKSDGTYAYAIVGDEVIIVRVWPFDQFDIVATIAPKKTPKNLYLAEDRLVILSGESTYVGWEEAYYPQPASFSTEEEVYDISNPSQPVLRKSMTYAGDLLSSRRIDSKVYLILSGRGVVPPAFEYWPDIDYASLPPCTETGEVQPSEELLNAIEQLKAKNRSMVNNMTLAQLMPDADVGNDASCGEMMRSTAASGTGLLTVATDAFTSDDTNPLQTSILSNAGSVYASQNAIYVTSSVITYGWWSMPDYEFTDSTVIHRFALDEGVPSYAGSGAVEGHLVDNSYAGSRYSERFSMAQFALSEHEGYLRVATTFDDFTDMTTTSDNRVTVLAIADSSLDTVGEVTGMGKGEKIHAVRFIGTRGYVVTYKKTDPLYVVDLSLPTEPKVTGELKVPGFSTYLHPLDADHLIGLGFASDDMGSFAWTQGLKLALYDVSDPTNPLEVGYREIGTRGSYSPAVEEHHAFTLDRGRGMLALPADIHEGGSGGSDYGEHVFAGVLLLKADLSGSFDTLGMIALESSPEDYSWWHGTTDVLRTIIIGDGDDEGIITLASDGVMLNRIDEEMTEIGSTF